MPRRAFWLLTLLVLALHWLVLHGLPLTWKGSQAPLSTAAFSTRSIAPPPPAETVAATAPAATPAPRPRPAPPKPPRKPRPAPEPTPVTAEDPPFVTAQATEEAHTPADSTPPPAEPLPGTASEDPVSAPPPVADPPPPDPATAASAPELPASTPPMLAASAPAPAAAQEDPGIDIVPPGSGSGQAVSRVPPSVKLPASTRLNFAVSGQAKRFQYNARAFMQWTHDGSRYEARQEVSAFLVGTRAQTSAGQVTDKGLLPTRFGDRARSEQAAHFDFSAGRVTFSANTPSASIAPGAQDRLSVFIQLAAMLAAEPARYPVGTEITLTTVSARASDRWTFRVEGEETLELPAGTIPTWKLQRVPRRDYDQKAELWLAPSQQYLPVRIRITQSNGDFADLQLTGSAPP